MWLGDSSASESITTVGRRVKERLGIDPQVRLLKPFHTVYESYTKLLEIHLRN